MILGNAARILRETFSAGERLEKLFFVAFLDNAKFYWRKKNMAAQQEIEDWINANCPIKPVKDDKDIFLNGTYEENKKAICKHFGNQYSEQDIEDSIADLLRIFKLKGKW